MGHLDSVKARASSIGIPKSRNIVSITPNTYQKKKNRTYTQTLQERIKTESQYHKQNTWKMNTYKKIFT